MWIKTQLYNKVPLKTTEPAGEVAPSRREGLLKRSIQMPGYTALYSITILTFVSLMHTKGMETGCKLSRRSERPQQNMTGTLISIFEIQQKHRSAALTLQNIWLGCWHPGCSGMPQAESPNIQGGLVRFDGLTDVRKLTTELVVSSSLLSSQVIRQPGNLSYRKTNENDDLLEREGDDLVTCLTRNHAGEATVEDKIFRRPDIIHLERWQHTSNAL